MGFNNVKIIQNGRHSKVFIDGAEVKGVTSVSYHNDLESYPSVRLEFYTEDTEIEVNEQVIDKTTLDNKGWADSTK